MSLCRADCVGRGDAVVGEDGGELAGDRFVRSGGTGWCSLLLLLRAVLIAQSGEEANADGERFESVLLMGIGGSALGNRMLLAAERGGYGVSRLEPSCLVFEPTTCCCLWC
jgi:hypothetical protein